MILWHTEKGAEPENPVAEGADGQSRNVPTSYHAEEYVCNTKGVGYPTP